MAAVTSRLEVRVRPSSKSLIEHAAALAHLPVSEFVRDAVEQRAEQVVAAHEIGTRVPTTFYDELVDALDAPAVPSAALTRAARRAAATVTAS